MSEAASRPTRRRPHGARRTALVIVAVIGLGLAVAPVAMNMFSRAPKGAVMLSDFKPFMTADRLSGFQSYMAEINSAVTEIDTKATPRIAAGHTDHHHATRSDASYRNFDRQWPAINRTMTDLLDKVQANMGNYQAMAALPSFRLFPWFFAIPGVLIFALALLALFGTLSTAATRVGLGVIGVALIAIPIASQMFTRAPHGAQMMSTFKTIETSDNVGRIQGYFSTMAVGQGAIRNVVVPELHDSGLSNAAIAKRYPAITALDTNWVHILNDMTPMIAAMSDSVPRYDAIRSLPPFTLFPWFFVLPGVLVIGLASVRSRKDPATPARPSRVAVPQTV